MRVADAVADADDVRGGQARTAPDAPGHHRHRVRVVEQEAVGAPLDHLVGHLDHDGDRAETAHDAADADRVADRLAQPERLRDVEVGPRRRVPADLDLVDQVVGAVERGRPRLVRRDPVAGVRALDELVGREQRVGQAFGVDVVEGDLERPVQLLVRAQVREDPPRELDAARADDRDLRHARESGTRPSGASTSTGNVPGVIVCVAANPSIDKLFEVERLVAGGIHRPLGFVQTAGGKGLNAARAAHRLGGDVRVVAILRGHAGRWLEETLQAEGIGGAFVWTHGENRSSLSVADRRTGGLTEFYEHGPVTPQAAWTELTEAASRLFRPGRLAHDLGLDPAGAVRRWLPRPGGGGASGGDAGGARRRGRAAASRPGGGTGDREGERRRGGGAARRTRRHAGRRRWPRARSSGSSPAATATPAIVTRGADGRLGRPLPTASGTRACSTSGAGTRSAAATRSSRVWSSGSSAEIPGRTRSRLALGAAAANAELPGAGALDAARADVLAARAEIREL